MDAPKYESILKAPEFVRIGGPNGTTLKRNECGFMYGRAAGQWGVSAHWVDGVLLSIDNDRDWLHGVVLWPCTEQEYKDDNAGYVY
jgi:hypothetical protein